MIILILPLQFFTFVAVFLLGFFILCKNPRSKVHWYFWIFATGTAGWNLALFLAISELGQPLLWGRLAFSFGILMPTGLLLFSKVFLSQKVRDSIFNTIVFFVGALFAIGSGVLIVKSARIIERTYISGEFTPFVLLYLLYFFGTLIYAFIILALKHKKVVGVEKMQLRYVLTGLLSFFVPFIITNLILPNIFGIFQYNNLGPIFTLPMMFLIAYTIVKHQLMDIRVVIQRGLIYSVLATLVLLFYVTVLNILGFIFQQQSQITAFLSAAFTTLIAVFSIPVIERYFRKITDKIFFKDKYDYKIALQELTEMLHRSIDMNDIMTMSQAKLKALLRTSDVHFSLKIPQQAVKKDTEIQLLDNGTRMYVPIMYKKIIKGAIVLGRKRSGDPYTSEDIRLLTTFSYQAAIALERATLYREVQEYSRSLEKKVKERTKEIEELQQAQKQMMIDISHGLQTPLTVVKGELGFLEKQMPKNKKLQVFEKSIDEVSTFVYDLLKLARLETVPKNFSKQRIALSDFLKEQVEYLAVVAKENKIALTSSLAKNVFVAGDEKKIEELVTNLVGNAMKYMKEKGERKIHITLWKKNKKAHIAIEDTGIGIAQKDLPHIFSRFYRIKNNRTADVKSTGLGLAIVKKIVEMHGGTIAVKSTLGKGTTFTITFPLLKK